MYRAILAATALAASAAPAYSQGEGLTRREKLRHDLGTDEREVRQVLVGFAAHAAAARHAHPGEEIVYVISGTLEYQLDGVAPLTLRAGDSLFIPAGVVHAVRNTGDAEASELATYVVDKSQPLILQPQ